jgi:hypothetical protein
MPHVANATPEGKTDTEYQEVINATPSWIEKDINNLSTNVMFLAVL